MRTFQLMRADEAHFLRLVSKGYTKMDNVILQIGSVNIALNINNLYKTIDINKYFGLILVISLFFMY